MIISRKRFSNATMIYYFFLICNNLYAHNINTLTYIKMSETIRSWNHNDFTGYDFGHSFSSLKYKILFLKIRSLFGFKKLPIRFLSATIQYM